MGFFPTRIMGGGIGGGASAFTLTATTTGADEEVTINRLTPSEDMDIDWGDGTVETISADDETAQTHTYASAGNHAIRVAKADVITQLRLSGSKISGLDTSQLQNAVLTYFYVNGLGTAEASIVKSEHMSGWAPTNWRLYSMPSGTYDIQSTHMSSWSLTNWRLYSMPAGTYDIQSTHMSDWSPTNWRFSLMPSGTYDIQSTHMSDWTPMYWQLFSIPAGTYDIQSTHMSGWTPATWHLFSMPSGNYVINAASDFDGWTSAIDVRCYTLDDDTNGKLLEADVDAILWGLYQATESRTVEGGTIVVSGTNDPPSGTYQAAASCPVDADTPGKEVAHELINDGCNAIDAGETWDTVTINT